MSISLGGKGLFSWQGGQESKSSNTHEDQGSVGRAKQLKTSPGLHMKSCLTLDSSDCWYHGFPRRHAATSR